MRLKIGVEQLGLVIGGHVLGHHFVLGLGLCVGGVEELDLILGGLILGVDVEQLGLVLAVPFLAMARSLFSLALISALLESIISWIFMAESGVLAAWKLLTQSS